MWTHWKQKQCIDIYARQSLHEGTLQAAAHIQILISQQQSNLELFGGDLMYLIT